MDPIPTPIIRIPKDMGMVWEAYHKGVPLLGVPGITLEYIQPPKFNSLLHENCTEPQKESSRLATTDLLLYHGLC